MLLMICFMIVVVGRQILIPSFSVIFCLHIANVVVHRLARTIRKNLQILWMAFSHLLLMK